MFSNNGKTFVAAATWLRKLMKDERVQDWLADKRINHVAVQFVSCAVVERSVRLMGLVN